MKNLFFKMTPDGVFHLWLDDSTKDGFQKLAKSKRIKVIKDRSYVVMFDNETSEKRLFGILNDELFEVKLPDDSEVEYTDNVCIFSRGAVWYTIINVDGVWTEQLLGKKKEIDLVWTAMAKYNRSEWTYFLKEQEGNLIELGYFMDGVFFSVGTFSNVFGIKNGIIAAHLEDGFFNFYNPSSVLPITNIEGDTFVFEGDVIEALDGVFLWSKSVCMWKFYSNCALFGNNAVVRIIGEYGKNIELYRIEGDRISLVDSGAWKWISSKFFDNYLHLCIEGKIYHNKGGNIDFEYPTTTLKKWIKDFFKRK